MTKSFTNFLSSIGYKKLIDIPLLPALPVLPILKFNKIDYFSCQIPVDIVFNLGWHIKIYDISDISYI